MTVSKGMKPLSRKYVLKIEIFTNANYCSPEKCWVRYTRYINQLLTGKPPKCWVCDTSTHWVDQWEKLKSMAPEERLKSVRKNMPASVVLRMLVVTTEHQIVADESSAPKKLTMTSGSIIITFSCIQQRLWMSHQCETIQKQCYQFWKITRKSLILLKSKVGRFY